MMTSSSNRDHTLFSDERIKKEYLALLANCGTTEERVGYLRQVGFHGFVGDGNNIAQDRETAEYFVARITEPETIELMYGAAVHYFASRPAKAVHLTECTKSLDGSGGVVLSPVLDRSFLYVGRSDSINDWHYRMRSRLYGFPDDVIASMPFSGVSVRKRCNYCYAENWPLRTCQHCRDVHYCDQTCQHNDWKSHHDYCARSVVAQCLPSGC